MTRDPPTDPEYKTAVPANQFGERAFIAVGDEPRE
jgi:hypothetical protein